MEEDASAETSKKARSSSTAGTPPQAEAAGDAAAASAEVSPMDASAAPAAAKADAAADSSDKPGESPGDAVSWLRPAWPWGDALAMGAGARVEWWAGNRSSPPCSTCVPGFSLMGDTNIDETLG